MSNGLFGGLWRPEPSCVFAVYKGGNKEKKHEKFFHEEKIIQNVPRLRLKQGTGPQVQSVTLDYSRETEQLGDDGKQTEIARSVAAGVIRGGTAKWFEKHKKN